MSDLTAYTPRDLTRPDLLDPVTDGWIASIAEVAQLAAYIADTAFVPQPLRGNAPAVAATILYGREIGIAPITALQTMHVINGRVGMAAELMRARVLAAGHEIEVVESTAALCRIRGRRRGAERWAEVQWSKGDAQQAGLQGDGWRKYPRAMLIARASAELCRVVFPDVTHGMLATEELDDTSEPSTSEPSTTSRRVARAARVAPSITSSSGRAGPPAPLPAAAPPTPLPGEVGRDSAATEPAADRPPGAVPPATVDPSPREGRPHPRAGTPPEVPEPPARGVEDSQPPPRVGAPPIEEVERMPGEEPLPFVGTERHGLAVVEDHGEDHPAPVEVIEADPLVGDEADPRAQGRLKGDGPATRAQTRHVMALLRRLDLGASREERLHVGQALVGRRVESFSDLTVTDAGRMITTLLIALDSDNPGAMIRHVVDEEHRRLAEIETGIGDE